MRLSGSKGGCQPIPNHKEADHEAIHRPDHCSTDSPSHEADCDEEDLEEGGFDAAAVGRDLADVLHGRARSGRSALALLCNAIKQVAPAYPEEAHGREVPSVSDRWNARRADCPRNTSDRFPSGRGLSRSRANEEGGRPRVRPFVLSPDPAISSYRTDRSAPSFRNSQPGLARASGSTRAGSTATSRSIDGSRSARSGCRSSGSSRLSA
jgi:hypothetical protein